MDWRKIKLVKAQKMPDGTFHIDADEMHEITHTNITLPKSCKSLFDKIQHENGYDINPKTVPIGSVLYYTTTYDGVPYLRIVHFGLVVEHYCDCVIIEKLEKFDDRTIDGVPVKEFMENFPTSYKKLPKEWGYGHPLFKVGNTGKFANYTFDCRKPEQILKAVNDGALVRAKENLHVTFNEEIDRHKGWRIYAKWENYQDILAVDFHNAFETFEDAQAACDDINSEYKRQAAMSDYDWSVEKINEAIDDCWNLTDVERSQYREWLLSRKNVEDIEARAFCGKIQWKYAKNKKWLDIVL